MRGNLACCLLTLSGLYGCQGHEAHGSPAAANTGPSAALAIDHHIVVDQFGYLPDETKIAVIRDPVRGYDQNDHFTPGGDYQLRRSDTGEPVFRGSPVVWKGGTVDALSGDRGWWFDFSAVATPGRYFVFDVARNVRSPVFSIDPQVYRAVLKDAMRTYYYQRAGMAKRAPFAARCWIDGPAYLGPQQDGQARDITDRDNPAKVRDLRGGWFDAGDTNKYVTFATQAVHQLLTAYETNRSGFTDDFAIPESGNGISDVIDEVHWETDWLKRMQYPDGSFALKVGELVYVTASPPSSDHSARFYVPACTSATIAGSGMLAHAAYVFRGFPTLAREAEDLQRRALLAWEQYQHTHPQQTACDSGIVHAGNADLTAEDQDGLAVEAAVYLFALTQDAKFERYIEENYRHARPYHDTGWSRYKADQGESLLFYTTLPFAPDAMKKTLLADKLADVQAAGQIYGFDADADLYRAFLNEAQYHWGSNNPRANYGNTNLDVLNHAVQAGDAARFRDRALGILHYFHGVNPLGIVYLSNMYADGASSSVNEIYHVAYAEKTRWSDARTSECGPPPGFVPGGPNAAAAHDGVPSFLSPPTGQPPQKSYRDWNGITPDSSWALTEPGIYYQSAYVRLLSAFVR